MIKAGIVGGAGYTGGELIRILINHPHCGIKFIQSRSQSGKEISDVHTDLLGETNLKFSQDLDEGVDVLFLCLGHGESKVFLDENKISQNIKVIDLSQDFRLESEAGRKFIYGLPEANRAKIPGGESSSSVPAVPMEVLPTTLAGCTPVHPVSFSFSTPTASAMSHTPAATA